MFQTTNQMKYHEYLLHGIVEYSECQIHSVIQALVVSSCQVATKTGIRCQPRLVISYLPHCYSESERMELVAVQLIS